MSAWPALADIPTKVIVGLGQTVWVVVLNRPYWASTRSIVQIVRPV